MSSFPPRARRPPFPPFLMLMVSLVPSLLRTTIRSFISFICFTCTVSPGAFAERRFRSGQISRSIFFCPVPPTALRITLTAFLENFAPFQMAVAPAGVRVAAAPSGNKQNQTKPPSLLSRATHSCDTTVVLISGSPLSFILRSYRPGVSSPFHSLGLVISVNLLLPRAFLTYKQHQKNIKVLSLAKTVRLRRGRYTSLSFVNRDCVSFQHPIAQKHPSLTHSETSTRPQKLLYSIPAPEAITFSRHEAHYLRFSRPHCRICGGASP